MNREIIAILLIAASGILFFVIMDDDWRVWRRTCHLSGGRKNDRELSGRV